MGRQRNPNRDKSKKMWLESNGSLTTKELAIASGVPESRVRKWKSEDNWKEELEKKKRGGQRGNSNARGHGAPTRNINAMTHGAYKTMYFDELEPEEKELIESIDLDAQTNMLRELRTLIAKENDLKKRIRDLNNSGESTMYVDRVVEMFAPQKKEDKGGEEEPTNDSNEELKTRMKTVIKASAFDRALKLEAELNKVHGRIIKLLDSIKSYELETRRIELEEKKYTLSKQKITGEFDINPKTGEVDDDYNAECNEK